MFVITGITGHVGRVTATQLLDANHAVRAVVRNPEKGSYWQQAGAETAVANLFDEPSLTRAFSDAEGVFIMTPPAVDLDNVLEMHLQMLDNIISSLKKAGPKKVVYLSSIGGQLPEGTGAIRKLYDMEQALKQLDIPTAGIRAGWFMENWAGLIPGAVESGKLWSFINPTDLQVPMVAVEDIGKTAATLLTQEWTGHRIIELGGPCHYSANDVAAVLGYQTGKHITAVALPRREYEGIYSSFGFTEDASRLMAEMNDGFNSGLITFAHHDTEYLSGDILLEDMIRTYIK